VVNLLPQFFQRSPQVSRHGVLVGFVFGSDRHFFAELLIFLHSSSDRRQAAERPLLQRIQTAGGTIG
jgi:hypothetical protein